MTGRNMSQLLACVDAISGQIAPEQPEEDPRGNAGAAGEAEATPTSGLLRRAFCCNCANRSNSPATLPPSTGCFDIFSPLPGDNEVTSQVDLLSSKAQKLRQDQCGQWSAFLIERVRFP